MTVEEIENYKIHVPDQSWYCQSVDKWNGIAKPLYSLGKLEDVTSRIVAIQENLEPVITKRAILIMCADNGIVEEKVTQTDSSVTAVVAENMAKGVSSVCRMAALAKTAVIPVDVGMAGDVGHPAMLQKKVAAGTKNFAKEEAMTKVQMEQAVTIGLDLVRSCKEQGYHILGTGEMGIGNTSTSTAVICAMLGLSPSDVTGRGAGLSDEGLERKRKVIAQAIKYHVLSEKEPWRILQCVGGFDIAALVGVFLGGAFYHMPIVLDGVITAAAALLAAAIRTEAKEYMIASHCSREPAMEKVLEALELQPLIAAEMALGEGCGVAMLFPMLDMALAVYNQNLTFTDIQIEAYQSFTKN